MDKKNEESHTQIIHRLMNRKNNNNKISKFLQIPDMIQLDNIIYLCLCNPIL